MQVVNKQVCSDKKLSVLTTDTVRAYVHGVSWSETQGARHEVRAPVISRESRKSLITFIATLRRRSVGPCYHARNYGSRRVDSRSRSRAVGARRRALTPRVFATVLSSSSRDDTRPQPGMEACCAITPAEELVGDQVRNALEYTIIGAELVISLQNICKPSKVYRQ
ncbi:unnamed protein product [Euphydryas editha]|uniref:Uncharacterized protein n=1 Tax=Euphydryas editha TaxID=104508 RepID=A0AAU9UYU6_EUPED|nr:unnamed protein product [Euphydryas editha]